MVGLLPGEAVMSDRMQALGYVEVETQERSVLGPPGLRFRGHQFRYSELAGVPDDLARIYSVRRRRGGDTSREGYSAGNVLASYVHAHWASNPGVARNLVDACARRAGR
jgi:cobyrinic acid a,c-diamide synthase